LVKLNKCGTIYAVSYCNIHGLWENSKKIRVKE
jgi:superoxide reductase